MKYLLFLFYFCTLNVFAKNYSLKDLVHYSLRHSPDIKNFELALQKEKLNVDIAKTLYLPSIDLSTSQGLVGTSSSSPKNDWVGELSLTATETLYNNGENLKILNVAKLNRDKEKVNLKNKKELSVLKVVSLYYQYLKKKRESGVNTRQVEMLDKQFRVISLQYKQGIKRRIDYLRFNSRLKKSKLDLKNFEISRKSTLEEIKGFVGWEEADPLLLLDEKIENIEEVLIWNTKDLILKNKSYKILELTTDILNLEVKKLYRDRWPVIILESNYSYTNSDYLGGVKRFQESDGTNWEALLKVTWNLWDWGARKKEYNKAQIDIREAVNFKKKRQFEIRQEVAQLKNKYLGLKSSLELSKELMTLEKKNYDSLAVDYENGQVGFTGLNNALNNFSSSERAYFRNYYELKEALYEYYYYKGVLLEKIL